MENNINNWVKIDNYEDAAWVNLSRVSLLTIGSGGTNYYYIYADGEQIPVKFPSKYLAQTEVKKIMSK